MKTLLFFLSALVLLSAEAQLNPVNLQIPMSDGQTLAAHLYQPDNCTECPVIFIQTPYNKNFYQLIGLPLGIGQNVNNSNYAIVIMDWRGFWGSSSAAYSGSPTRGEDGYDAVEWIYEQPWCNGQIGTWGPSALGVIQFQTARENPPHLKCICPLVAGPQQKYNEYYPGGALRTEYIQRLDQLGFGLGPFVIGNPYASAVWTFSQNNSFYPADIQVPALMIGGWYDHNVDVMIEFFSAIRTQSPLAVRDKHRLLMGPWTHGGSGQAVVGSTTQGELEFPNAGGYETQTALSFFDFYLRNIDNGWDETPYVTYYQPGENQWHEADTWPPGEPLMMDLFLRDDNLLLPTSAPTSHEFTYSYNPNDPSPTHGGPTLDPSLDQGPYDQSSVVESRDDIVIFTTPPFTAPVAMKGKSFVKLFVSTDRPDTDFAVRLTDVYPDGRSMLVCDGIGRLRFRNGYTAALEAMAEPGQVYELTIELPHTAITFPAGHRLRVDITSSNYPRFNRNMNTGLEMYPGLNADILVNPQTAQNKIHIGPDRLSRIQLPVNGLPIGIAENRNEKFDNIYPNPTTDFFQIPACVLPNTTLRIYNVSGVEIMRIEAVKANESVDIRQLPAGVYPISYTTTEGQLRTEKLILAK